MVKIDTDEMENGKAVAEKLGASGGLPWMTILDSAGKELVTSDGPDGNVGCPVTEGEQAHFISMLKQTVQHADEETLNALASNLKEYAETLR